MDRTASSRTFVALGALLATACATPVGVDRATPREVQRELTESVLSGDRPSAPTREFLTRTSLVQRWDDDPDGTLLELHRGLAPAGDLDRLYALAELSFLRAGREQDRAHALAAALYAYAFLFGSDGTEARRALDPFDPRIQIARNLYNRGLTFGLGQPGGEIVDLSSRRLALPFGTLDVASSPGDFVWAGWSLTDFTAVADYRVRGLDNRYRKPGIGAPLAARLGDEVRPTTAGAHVAKRLRVPVTAFLRLDGARAQLASGHVAGALELYSEDERSELVIDGEVVPIELEKSSSLAYTLEGAPIWDFGLAGFRLGDYLPTAQADRLVLLHPHRPGRIPLVLVHGTFSSPATWAQLVNELENDPDVARRYEIWLFLYNSGNPIVYSAGLLAESLQGMVGALDPQGGDPALRRMVIVGHSQGGLLTKLMTVHSGDVFWSNIARKPIDEVKLDPDSRALLRRSMFFEPLPFVQRVVFMSTPHHGSYLSDLRVTSWISRLVKMPARVTKLAVDIATKGGDEFYLSSLDRMPTSLDNMASKNKALRALAGLPIDPRVRYHSIIAVRGGPPWEDGGDGVVRYASAHLEGAESEKVVKSGHSVQMTQEGIQELRRILLAHVATAP